MGVISDFLTITPAYNTWHYRRKGSHHLLRSREGKLLRSLRAGLDFLVNSEGFEESDRLKLESFIKRVSKPGGGGSSSTDFMRINRARWQENDSVPNGWRIRLKKNGKQLFLSPENAVYASRRRVIEFMVNEGLPEKDIDHVKKFLHLDDWKGHDKLPEGWRFKVTEGYSVKIMSDRGNLLTTSS